MDPQDRLTELLHTDLDTHLVTLKFLRRWGPQSRVVVDEAPGGWSARVEMPADLFAWDRLTYPGASTIGFLAGNDPAGLLRQVDAFPRRGLVVKTAVALGQAALVERGLEPTRTFWWYETREIPKVEAGQTRLAGGQDEDLRHLLRGNGYADDELDGWFAEGAFGVIAGEEPRAFCLVYPNFGPVWEIGSVKTFAPYRRQGWGRAVVARAVAEVLGRGWRVRYHVEGTNTASRALAESLGLVPRVVTHHFVR